MTLGPRAVVDDGQYERDAGDSRLAEILRPWRRIDYRRGMTTTRLAVLAFAVLGLWWIVKAVVALPILLEADLAGVSLSSFGLMLFGGILVFVFRTGLARWLFRADDERLGTISVVDAQVVGLILFGVWIVSHEVPAMIIEYGREGSKLTAGGYVAMGIHTGLGCLLIFRSEWIARLWCRDA